MEKYKDYIKRLFDAQKVNIEKHHQQLFNDFLESSSITEAYNLIQDTQTNIIDRWMKKKCVDDIQSAQIVLTNGTVNKQYDLTLDLSKHPFNNISAYNIEVDSKAGIAFDNTTGKLSGMPIEAGEYMLAFNFKLKSDAEENLSHKKELKLIINPDPKSLWKNIESDKTEPYWKADDASKSAELDFKKLVIGSKRGRSHAHEGTPRDDDFDFSFQKESGWVIITLADGAGSAKYSRKGSEIACKTVVEYFKNIDREKLQSIESTIVDILKESNTENQKKLSNYFVEQLGKAAFLAHTKIKEEANAKEAAIKDYSTTLMFVLLKKYEEKFVIASFWVGDGGVGIYNKERNEISVLGTPDSGEFAGQTRFLTMNDIFSDGAYANRVKFKIVDDFTSLILMTDGITDPKFQTDANLNKVEKWNELWDDLNGNNEDNIKIDFTKPLENVEADLMSWLDFWSPGNHDDRTIAILY